MKNFSLLLSLLSVPLAATEGDRSLDHYRKKVIPDAKIIKRYANYTGRLVGSDGLRYPETPDDFRSHDDAGQLAILDAMSQSFASALYGYVDKTLLQYCRSLRDAIKTSSGGGGDDLAPDTVDRMRFEERGLCVVSFLFHFHAHVDAIFRIASVLRELSAERTGRRRLLGELELFIGGRETDDGDDESATNPSGELSRIKENYLNVSKTFCSKFVRQLVIGDIHFRGNISEYWNYRLVNHVFNAEQFAVTFDWIDGKDEIMSWDVSYVLKSPEFQVAEYMKTIKVDRDTSETRLEKPAELWNNRDATNLESLRKRMTSGSAFYFNKVVYLNILLEVMLLAAVKEGNKVLQAAMDLLRTRCPELADGQASISETELKFVYGKLKGLNYAFCRIAEEIDQLIRLGESTRAAGKSFQNNVDALVDAFRWPENQAHSQFVNTLCSTRAPAVRVSDVPRVLAESVYDVQSSRDYYLINPQIWLDGLLWFIKRLF